MDVVRAARTFIPILGVSAYFSSKKSFRGKKAGIPGGGKKAVWIPGWKCINPNALPAETVTRRRGSYPVVVRRGGYWWNNTLRTTGIDEKRVRGTSFPSSSSSSCWPFLVLWSSCRCVIHHSFPDVRLRTDYPMKCDAPTHRIARPCRSTRESHCSTPLSSFCFCTGGKCASGRSSLLRRDDPVTTNSISPLEPGQNLSLLQLRAGSRRMRTTPTSSPARGEGGDDRPGDPIVTKLSFN